MVNEEMAMKDDMYLLAGSEDLSREFNAVGAYYSDFYKEVHGVRPRHMALLACKYPDHASLVEAMSHLQRLVDGLDNYLDTLKSTFEGREELRAEGWYVGEETDPQLAAISAANQAARDAGVARQEYECSWEYHAEMVARAEEAKQEELEDALEAWYWRKYEAV
jgi:hypothetical protein